MRAKSFSNCFDIKNIYFFFIEISNRSKKLFNNFDFTFLFKLLKKMKKKKRERISKEII